MEEIKFTEDFLYKICQLFFIALVIIVSWFGAIGLSAYLSKQSSPSARATAFNDALERLQVLRIVMAVIMVFAATMLALSKIISGDAVVTLISGIVGYVLGALAKPNPKNKNKLEAGSNDSVISQPTLTGSKNPPILTETSNRSEQ